MKGKDAPGKIRTWDTHATQNQGHQNGRTGVHEDVDQVVAERRVTPTSVLDPKHTMQQGVVLLRRVQVRPDLPQTVQRSQLRSGNVCIIIPNESTSPGRLVGQEHRDQNYRRVEQIPTSKKRFSRLQLNSSVRCVCLNG